MKVVKKILLGILGIVFFVFVIAMTILKLNHNDYGIIQFGGTSLIMITEDISSDNYKKGDLIFVEAVKFDKISMGDELFVYKVDNKTGSVEVELGIVGEIHETDNAVSFENGATYTIKYFIGKPNPDKVYHDIGSYLSVIQSKWGFLFIILVPSFVILICEVYAIAVEVKYGKKES